MQHTTQANKYTRILAEGKPQNLTFAILNKLAQWYPAQLAEYCDLHGTLLEATNTGNGGRFKSYNLAGFIVNMSATNGELQSIKIK